MIENILGFYYDLNLLINVFIGLLYFQKLPTCQMLKKLLFPTYPIFKESKSCKEEHKITRTLPCRSLKHDVILLASDIVRITQST
jgi:hypothetical protein